MSDTRRWVHPLALTVEWWTQRKLKSRKHQARDRSERPCTHQFIQGVKNSRYNLLRKIEQLRNNEARETT